ncbi:MAG: hypothetical protein K9J37_06310 [Saprospiraceae bacterium]|nr:hypothetical protein [Saprospiraceae bacterium]MCF8249505.1 hypothetical protein [Saprospiraceae bacterium]MCF8280130.1 hypothetical protein [Bacteroidales bacterium]MCF8310723.1 hypothetical protein [Saprospiraceae bacterium]MCF8439446.1 hypothetical protein [Saprospiraceae bacterium]
MVNEIATEGCVTGQFATFIGVDGNDVGFNMPYQSSPYTYPNQTLLFTVVVDAFPGEALTFSLGGTFTSGPLICPNMLIQPCQGGTGIDVPYTMPEPAACQNPSPGVGVEDVSAGNPYNMPVDIPVYYDKGTTGASSVAIDEIDVAIKMSSTNLMELPTILAGAIAVSDVRVVGNGNGYTIYAHARNISLFTGANGKGVLFTIKLNGPVFLSAGGSATFSTTNSRVQLAGATCCKPSLGSPVTVEFAGFPPCTEDITINMGAPNNLPPGTGEQCEAATYVTFSWPGAPVSRTFYKITLVVDVETSGNVSILGMGNSDIVCPTPGSGASYCGGSSCFTILDPNTFQYCFWTFGTGVNVVNETGFLVNYDVSSGCIEGLTFREAYIDLVGGGPSVACVPNIVVNTNDFPICSPMIAGEILKENNVLVENSYDIDIAGINCSYNLPQTCESIYAKCVCNPNGQYMVTPSKTDNVLCGVSTYDLVLINKHILNIANFTTPYQWIAADITNNGQVTNNDLNEIRKAVLHINEEFTGAPSWKFIDKNFQYPPFPMQSNQYLPIPYPTSIQVSTLPSINSDFVAVKMGDVNLSCGTGGCFTGGNESEDREREELMVSYQSYGVAKDEIITIPIQMNTNTALSAYQMGIRFNNMDALEFIGPAKADIEGISNKSFGLTELGAGKLRMLWFSADGGEHQKVVNGQKLYYLAFKAKKDLKDFGSEIWLDDTVLPNVGYDNSGNEFRMELRTEKIDRTVTSANQIVSCHPNPFAGELSFSIFSTSMSEAKIWLFDAFGVRRVAKTVALNKGLNEIMLEESKSLPNGLFNWVVTTPDGRQSGMVVKQTQP